MLHLILGVAALQRCNNGLVFINGFSRCGPLQHGTRLFPQPLQPYRSAPAKMRALAPEERAFNSADIDHERNVWAREFPGVDLHPCSYISPTEKFGP
jgi:hypothetical protein